MVGSTVALADMAATIREDLLAMAVSAWPESHAAAGGRAGQPAMRLGVQAPIRPGRDQVDPYPGPHHLR